MLSAQGGRSSRNKSNSTSLRMGHDGRSFRCPQQRAMFGGLICTCTTVNCTCTTYSAMRLAWNAGSSVQLSNPKVKECRIRVLLRIRWRGIVGGIGWRRRVAQSEWRRRPLPTATRLATRWPRAGLGISRLPRDQGAPLPWRRPLPWTPHARGPDRGDAAPPDPPYECLITRGFV